MTDAHDDIQKLIIQTFFEAFEIDSSADTSIIPNDVVKIDLRPELSRLEQTLRQIRTATYGQLDYDDMTKKVSFGDNNQSQQSPQSQQAQQKGSGKPGEKEIGDFLKMLKQNGAMEQLKNLDVDTKSKIAAEILKMVNSPNPQAPTSPTTPSPTLSPEEEKELQNNVEASKNVSGLSQEAVTSLTDFAKKSAKTFKTDQEFFDAYIKADPTKIDPANEKQKNAVKNAWHALNDKNYITINEEMIWLMKEAIIYLFEEATTPPASAAPATPTPAATPPAPAATPATPAATTPAAPPALPKKSADAAKAKFLAVQKSPKQYGIDPNDEAFKAKKEFVDSKINSYTTLKKIPGATEMELIGLVKNVDTSKGMVKVELMQKTSNGKNGKSDFKETGQEYDIPLKSVKSKIEGAAKKKGMLGKVGDWLTR
jgi:hypothetical protein